MADTREELIELLKEADRKAYEVAESRQLTHPFEVWEIQADHLIANGVTLATDNNVAAKTECEYCQQFDDPCGVPMIAAEDSDPDRGIYLYNGFLCASGGEFCEAKVNFCPMCGRKLSEPPKGE